MTTVGAPGSTQPSRSTLDDELAALRAIIVGPEQDRLTELANRLDSAKVEATDVSRVLAEAVSLRAAQDEALERALQPIIARALARAVREEPQIVTDAIYPVIGPAIRRAVASALRGMVDGLNRTLADVFSINGLRWRFQAWRTGRPFAEVVLMHGLTYRVEQVYLIHRETGLLLEHVFVPDLPDRGGDMVAGMLAAIRDFVSDSFGVAEGETLEAMEVGDVSVWVEPSPTAIIAAVVRGIAPTELRATLQDSIAAIQHEFGAELRSFTGDVSPFSATRPLLERCLGSS